MAAKQAGLTTHTMTRRTFAAAAAATLAGLVSGCTGSSDDGGQVQVADGEGSSAQPAGSAPQPAADAAQPAESPVYIEGTAITEEELASRIDGIVGGLSLAQKVGQLFIVRPESILNGDASIPDDYLDGVTVPDETFASAYGEVQPGGVCLFDKNLVSPDQTRLLVSAVDSMSRASGGIPAFIAVDEEGGPVARIANNPAFGVANVGAMGDLGSSGDAQVVRDASAVIAGYLGSLGFNLDFAPVCDVCNNPASTTMVGRSFGSDAGAVCTMVDAAVRGFSQGGIMCAAKHFPGIGGAEGDSHVESIYTHKSVEELASQEFLPFATAVQSGVPLVMMGHIVCVEASGSDLPASVCAAAVGDWLRGRLGFEGIVVTDSFEMESVVQRFGWGDAAVAALQAGVDVVLLPMNLRVAIGAVLAAVADGRLSEARIDESLRRVVRRKMLWDCRTM